MGFTNDGVVVFDPWNDIRHYEVVFDFWNDIRHYEEMTRNMRHCEWVIHRKLSEAAESTHRYILPARGGGQSLFIDSFDDPKKILRKNQNDPDPQEFVTIKDGDVEKWLRTELNRQVIEDICATFREFDRKAATRRYLTSFNPYLQPEGYWYDPSWEVRPDGTFRLRELSIMPGYLLNKEDV